MIAYNLICSDGHEFEGWFKDSAAFDAQAKQGVVTCPFCGDDEVKKAIMAPAVKTSVTINRRGSPCRPSGTRDTSAAAAP